MSYNENIVLQTKKKQYFLAQFRTNVSSDGKFVIYFATRCSYRGWRPFLSFRTPIDARKATSSYVNASDISNLLFL